MSHQLIRFNIILILFIILTIIKFSYCDSGTLSPIDDEFFKAIKKYSANGTINYYMFLNEPTTLIQF